LMGRGDDQATMGAVDAEAIDTCNRTLLQRNSRASSIDNSKTDRNMPACELPICTLHPPNAPRMWVAEHSDGAGHRMQNIINGLAVAQKLGMNFGGVVAVEPMTDQRVNFRKVARSFFGSDDDNVSGMFAISQEATPPFDFTFDSELDLESRRNEIADGATVFLPVAYKWNWNHQQPTSLYFPVELRRRLGASLASKPLLFVPDNFIVAVHLRRGDIGRDHNEAARLTPDEFYYRVVDEIRASVPSAEVHVWAALGNPYGDGYWQSADFEGFRARGMQVHLDSGLEDEDSIIDTWAHMARANVFVSSVSDFIFAPSVTNCRCVIYPGNSVWMSLVAKVPEGSRALDNWMNGNNEERASYETELKACIQRGQAPSPC